MAGAGGLKRPKPKLCCRAIEEKKNKQEKKKKIPPIFWYNSVSIKHCILVAMEILLAFTNTIFDCIPVLC
jgi:hypothetical protein